MAEFPKLPLWTDALIGDTFHLTPAEFGAYMRLLIVAWRRKDCALPADDLFLGRCIGDPKNWHRLKPRIIGFFQLSGDGFYRQMRLLDERESCARYAENATARGKASALKRKNRGVDGLRTVPKQEATPNPNPNPNPNPSFEKKGARAKRAVETEPIISFPDWWPTEEWVAFVQARSRGRHPVTADVSIRLISKLTALRDEGNDPAEVINEAIMNGWRGFFPLRRVNGNGRHKPTKHDTIIAGFAEFAGYEVGNADDYEGRTRGDLGGHILDLPSISVKSGSS